LPCTHGKPAKCVQHVYHVANVDKGRVNSAAADVIAKRVAELVTGRMRQCGDCQLCCKLLPVRSLGKAGGQKCEHQSHAKGCGVYAKLMRVAPECRLWSCRWLVEDDTADLRRPDRSHYVIDIMPDFVTFRNETGVLEHVQVVQIWVDPKHRDAHRDPALRAYLERRGEERIIGLVRWSETEGIGLMPPGLTQDGEWHEKESGGTTPSHTPEQLLRALGRPNTPL
jgi:hypothetical protein